MKKSFLALLLTLSSSIIYASMPKYTISVCMTSNFENALTCKKRVLDSMEGEVFIVKDKNNKFHTYLNIFEEKEKAQQSLKYLSEYVKEQKPYVKLLSNQVVSLKAENKMIIDLNEEKKSQEVETVLVKKDEIADIKSEKLEGTKESFTPVSALPSKKLELVSSYPFKENMKLIEAEYKEEPIKEDIKSVQNDYKEQKKEKLIEQKEVEVTNTQEELRYFEELKQISMDEFDREVKKEKPKKIEQKRAETTILNYDEIIIEVDSITNSMSVKAKVDNELKDIKNYIVSTAKKNIDKPLGLGKVSQISLNPTWYPTKETLKSFAKRGISLPSIVPPGHKYNYMGSAKINLTHKVNGKNTFRIHGTLDEKTIGTNESAGCIRMKNSDVVQLATLINDFANINSLDKVKVILK